MNILKQINLKDSLTCERNRKQLRKQFYMLFLKVAEETKFD